MQLPSSELGVGVGGPWVGQVGQEQTSGVACWEGGRPAGPGALPAGGGSWKMPLCLSRRAHLKLGILNAVAVRPLPAAPLHPQAALNAKVLLLVIACEVRQQAIPKLCSRPAAK